MKRIDFERVKKGCMKQLARILKLRDTPDNLIINLDQIGVNLIPTGDWSRTVQGRVGCLGWVISDISQSHL